MFQFYVDEAGEHRWRFVAGNGEATADSGEGYKTRAAAVRAARRTRALMVDADIDVAEE